MQVSDPGQESLFSSTRQYGKDYIRQVAAATMVEPGYYLIRGSKVFVSQIGNQKTFKIWNEARKKWKTAIILTERSAGQVDYGFNSIGAVLHSAMTDFLYSSQELRVEYSKATNQCCICNRPLTDPRSVHYSIGPDCELDHPEVISHVDNLNGGTWEEMKHDLA